MPALDGRSSSPLSQTAANTLTPTLVQDLSTTKTTKLYSSDGVPLQRFSSMHNSQRIRPVIFKPNGSFRVLKETGKLRCTEDEQHIYKGRMANPLVDTPHYIPGYTGFVRGRQHLAGRTYGETTRRALTTPYNEIVVTETIPSKPNENRKIEQKELKESFVHSVFGEKRYHLPGYTGFVPGIREEIGLGYGGLTNKGLVQNEQSRHFNDGQKEGFAKTAYGRQKLNLTSNPLPGGATSHQPPDMYIPENIKYLKYFPM